ncbi:hypothetical protein BOX15_Mlig005344g1 [Macrostomum lignano]|uniref:Uncharacterized protein n=1 Tax=Macrostomum lignano TaxID=282301 RepID=A0A267F7S5_9PLAT|nr:hypothetical protein BOX15_Mlig005344g1 [Macrostomum lignano]
MRAGLGQAEPHEMFSMLLLLTVAAAAAEASGSPACADYPAWLPPPWLADRRSGRAQAAASPILLNVSAAAYFAFAARYEDAVRSLGRSPGSCCGLGPEVPGLVLAEFDIRPQLPRPAGQQPAILASLLPFNNSLLQAQDSLLVAATRRLIAAGLFGRLSLYDFLSSREPELLAWLSQRHLFCLAQSRSRLRLLMARPLGQFEFEASMAGPFRMSFRLAPCRDRLGDEGRAIRFRAEVRLLL